MTCPLIEVPQLDGSRYAPVNCGPASAADALAFASCNAVRPTPMQVRRRGDMGECAVVHDCGTDLADLKRGVEAYAPEFAAEGLQAPQFIRLGYIDEAELAERLVQRTAIVTVSIRHGVLLGSGYESTGGYTKGHFENATKLYVPRASGVGYHRVRPRELERVDLADAWTLVVDPLADGRWSSSLGRRVVNGPQLWPLALLVKAADAWGSGGAGRFGAAVTYRAQAAA